MCDFIHRLFSDGRPANIRKVRWGYRVRRSQKEGRRRPKLWFKGRGELQDFSVEIVHFLVFVMVC